MARYETSLSRVVVMRVEFGIVRRTAEGRRENAADRVQQLSKQRRLFVLPPSSLCH